MQVCVYIYIYIYRERGLVSVCKFASLQVTSISTEPKSEDKMSGEEITREDALRREKVENLWRS